MSLILDNRQNNMDTEAEVAKLQLLVKQLELQNEELRSERSGSKPPPTQDEVTLSNIDNIDNSVHCTDLEVMEPLDTTALSDDENWLFESPKAKPHNEDWLRKDMDDPTLGGTRKTLLQKLDQIALSPRASPLHSRSPGSSSGSILSPESPPSSRGEIDTRTFVRPKKKRSIPYGEINDENRNMLIKKEAGSRECLARSSGSLGSEEDDRMSSASDGSFSYRLTDVEDVNAVARLQEESLRLPDPRRGGARQQGMRGGGGSGITYGSTGSVSSSQEDLLSGPQPRDNGSQMTPRRIPRSGGLQPPKRFGANAASREGSDLSTPPDSPYNSQNNLEACYGSNSRLSSGLNRRLGGSDPRLLEYGSAHGTPNGSRGASPARSYDSPHSSHSDLTKNRPSRMQAPKSRMGAPSPSRVPMGGPSGLPQPSKITGIPRPGASRLQQPRSRTGMQPPQFRTAPEEDWRDGCF